ncbi:hypothetical protein AMTRI_Chr01g108310 [Amborella trichopoda]
MPLSLSLLFSLPPTHSQLTVSLSRTSCPLSLNLSPLSYLFSAYALSLKLVAPSLSISLVLSRIHSHLTPSLSRTSRFLPLNLSHFLSHPSSALPLSPSQSLSFSLPYS